MPDTPSKTELANYLDFARETARLAGELTLRYFRTGVAVERKADASPVTIADREAELLIRDAIERRYPDHGILGEELGEERPGAARRWIIDPIDGTQAFVHGVPLYTVLLALEVASDAWVGVIHHPPSGETVAAARGLGCFCNGIPCRVSDTDALAAAWVHVTDYADLARRRPNLALALLRQAGFCRSWADAYGYMLVATGRADIMLDPVMHLWDSAALKPVIEEAGGCFSDLEGHNTIHGPSVLATNGRLHTAMLALAKLDLKK